jgi:Ca2+-transporting ATPase
MGVSGTDVAKESADIILSNDNFASIVAAVEEGRVIFNRLRNVCTFLLTTCFGELSGLIICVLFLGKAPLLSLQILWINLVTGVVISVPLGLEPKTGDELKKPPRDPKVTLIYKGMIWRIGYIASLLGISLFFIFDYGINFFDERSARTMTLTTVVIFEWLIALNMRSDEVSFYKQGVFKNRYLVVAITSAFILHLSILYIPLFQIGFKTVPLTISQWGICLIPGALISILETIRKRLFPTLFSKGKWKENE